MAKEAIIIDADSAREKLITAARIELPALDHSVGHYFPPCMPIVRPNVNAGEPISEWRRLSRVAGAIMRTTARVYEGKSADPTDWQTLKNDRTFGFSEFDIERPSRTKLDQAKVVSVWSINRWLGKTLI